MELSRPRISDLESFIITQDGKIPYFNDTIVADVFYNGEPLEIPTMLAADLRLQDICSTPHDFCHSLRMEICAFDLCFHNEISDILIRLAEDG